MRRMLIGAVTVALLLATSVSVAQQVYAPNGNYITPLVLSGVSTRTALPTGAVVVVYNTSAPSAFCRLGDATVVATTAHELITSGGFLAFTTGSNTFIACITGGAATTVNVSGGAGIPSAR